MRIHPMNLRSYNLKEIVSNNLPALTNVPKHLTSIKEKVIYKKLNDVNSWYTRIIGLDEVKLYQDRVVDLQEKLLTVQERRREIGLELAAIRKKSNELQDQLHKVKRQDDLQRFLDLMRDETEILKQEKETQEIFVNYDREERETFTAFTNAIRDSHEKQRAQLEYTKYLGLVLSIFGSFLAFSYSTLRKNDLKGFIESRMDEIVTKQYDATPVFKNLITKVQENEKRTEFVLKELQSNGHQMKQLINLKDSIESAMNEIVKKQYDAPVFKNLIMKVHETEKQNQFVLKELQSYSRQMKQLINQPVYTDPVGIHNSYDDSIGDYLPNKEKVLRYCIYAFVGYIVLRIIT